MKNFIFLLSLIAFFTFNSFAINEKDEEQLQEEFKQWIYDFKKTAIKDHKIDPDLLERAFEDVKYKKKVIKLDRNQPEFKKTFINYYQDGVHPLRIQRGKIRLKEHEKLLKEVEKKYDVPANIIVAFWGMETDYGRNMGRLSIIEVLSTLSFDNRRSTLFTYELVQAFKILQSGKMTLDEMKGSWAGAFGNFQFLPSTYNMYAVDCDGDKKPDLRNSLPDAFCSAANFLSKVGWKGYYRWGRPIEFDRENKKIIAELNSKEWKDLDYFSKLGVKRSNNTKLPNTKIKARLVAPMGQDGVVFLVYDNFRYIMRWNNSTAYALSIGLLSDALIDNKIGIIDKKYL